ncbi:hypothetical protein [Nonomuraea diastatica]|nr:hypothetical protein [Nonomuraea diastatica]
MVLSQLAARFPTLELGCAVEELTFDTRTLTGGLTSLPVAW